MNNTPKTSSYIIRKLAKLINQTKAMKYARRTHLRSKPKIDAYTRPKRIILNKIIHINERIKNIYILIFYLFIAFLILSLIRFLYIQTFKQNSITVEYSISKSLIDNGFVDEIEKTRLLAEINTILSIA